MEKQWIIFYFIPSSHTPYEVKCFWCLFAVDDAKDGCFSSFCMWGLSGVTLFFDLEYGSSLFDVANLEGTKYPYFWGHWEIYGFLEVFASWDIVWVVSYLGFYTMYFHFWFRAFYLCLICLYLFLVLFVHHHEHDVLFLMKISITYPKKKKNGPNMALKKFRVSVKVKRRERIGGDKCFVVSMNK